MSRHLFSEHLANANDVCSNCFGIRLVAPEPTQPDACKRNPRQTSVGHYPGDEPAHDVGIFCDCGVADPNTRLWDETDIDEDRFRTLLKRALRAAEQKGVTLDRKQALGGALEARRAGDSVNEALRRGLHRGSVTATTASATAD